MMAAMKKSGYFPAAVWVSQTPNLKNISLIYLSWKIIKNYFKPMKFFAVLALPSQKHQTIGFIEKLIMASLSLQRKFVKKITSTHLLSFRLWAPTRAVKCFITRLKGR